MTNQGSGNGQPYYGAPEPMQAAPAIQQPATNAEMNEAKAYQALYPEIVYKLQPYILMACDEMDTYGIAMPTQQQMENMSDSICENVCRMYPDMRSYLHSGDTASDPPDDPPFVPTAYRRGFGGRFRRRGIGRDLIDTLLLAELLNRRRYYY